MTIDYDDAARLVRLCILARKPIIPEDHLPDGVDLLLDLNVRPDDSGSGIDIDARGSLFEDRDRHRLILCFRGVDDWNDVYHFWRPGLTEFRDCLCHGGTLVQYIGLAPPLMIAIRKRIEEGGIDAVMCTGGSGGGAMALLAALDLTEQGLGVAIALRSFGSPKVFVRSAVDQVTKRLTDICRFVHVRDPVPHWPLTADAVDLIADEPIPPRLSAALGNIGNQYTHVGRCVVFHGERAVVGEGAAPIESGASLLSMLVGVTDTHFLPRYLERIEGQLESTASRLHSSCWLSGVLSTMMGP